MLHSGDGMEKHRIGRSLRVFSPGRSPPRGKHRRRVCRSPGRRKGIGIDNLRSWCRKGSWKTASFWAIVADYPTPVKKKTAHRAAQNEMTLDFGLRFIEGHFAEFLGSIIG